MELLERYSVPHHAAVAAWVTSKSGGASSSVLHLSVHSFTPVWKGTLRKADIGLLFDPSRALETALVRELRALLGRALPELRVRANYPYRGTSDGLTTIMRRKTDPTRYAGIELELNQALLDQRGWARRRRLLLETLQTWAKMPP